MVMNVMDPDRVFKGAEFNLLLPMKGKGHGKCRMGGKNIGGLLTCISVHSSAGPEPSASLWHRNPAPALCRPGMLLAPTHMAAPRVSPVILGVCLREKVLWISVLQADPCLCFHC